MSADRDRVAQALPGYVIGDELGRGSYGVVWAGEHRRVGRRVAIKELTAHDSGMRDRILGEAKVLALLEHPHVVPLYDYVEYGERCLLVMERLDGGSLATRFGGRGIEIESACAVAMVACAGLHHAHKRGVLHRDVKPENLLFSTDGVLKVADFGVAKVASASGTGPGRRTALGELKGTPAYMAPEQVTGIDLGPPVDVYATGLLLYELLSGRLPFSREGGPLAVAMRRLGEDPTPLHDVAPDLRGPLAEVVMQALSRSPGDRFATAEEFGVAVGRATTTVLGAGWLARSQVSVLSPGPILDATHSSGLSTPIAAAERRPVHLPASPTMATIGVVPGGERKHLTVLHVGIERSLDLQESLDPEEWPAIVDRFVGIITAEAERFEGTVETSTGDGITAVFGVPLALEDHAQRAGRAALAAIRSVEVFAAELRAANAIDFEVCIGLSSGEAVVERAGSDTRLDSTALGRTAALAQRMADLAPPGQVYATEQTARLVRAAFDLTDLGAMTVKGARAPMRVFVLVGPAVPGGVTSGRVESPMVGRAGDMARLEAALELALQGQAQVVGVVGEAGGGKSRLCDEFAALAASRGIAVRRTTGVSHGRTIPLLPVLGLLRDYFRIAESESRHQIWDKVSGFLLALDPAYSEDLPLLFDFIGEPDPDRPAPGLAPEVRMRRIIDLLRRLASQRSRQEPLILVLEDLQWFDPQSVSFVERLVEWITGSRTLVVTNFRPEFSAPWVRHPSYQQLTLSQLADGAVGELLAGLLGTDASLAPLTRFVADRTRGNPFFVEEVVRDLVEDATLVGGPGAYVLTRGVDEIHVPATVHAVLAARIDRLPVAHKALLQTASVIGRTFSQPLLARVLDVPASADPNATAIGRRAEATWVDANGGNPVVVSDGAGHGPGDADGLEEALRALCSAEMLQETGAGNWPQGPAGVGNWPQGPAGAGNWPPGPAWPATAGEYRFWHPLTQEVAYGTLLAKRRRSLHAAVAEARAALEPDRLDQNAAVLAWHWEKAGRRMEAARWNVRAAGFALRSDLGDALRRWQSAVDLLEGENSPEALELGVRARIFLLLFRARIGIDRGGSERLYTEANGLAVRLGDLGMQGLVDLVAGSVSIYAGDVVGGLHHYLDAARLAEATDDPEFRAALVSGVPFALSYLGPLADAMMASDRLQAECGDVVDRGASVLGYSVLARSLRVRAMILARAGRLADAEAALERSIALARPRGDSDTLCWALPIRSHLAWLSGEATDTRGSAAETVRLAEDTGNVLGLVFGLEGQALAHLVSGQPAAAVAACERALAEAQDHSGLNEEAGVLAVLGLAQLAAGDVPGALTTATAGVAVAQRQGLRVVECQALLVRAQVRRAAGEPDAVVTADLSAAAELVRTSGALTFEPFIIEELGRLGSDGASDGADVDLRAALALYRGIGATGHARRLEAELDARSPASHQVPF